MITHINHPFKRNCLKFSQRDKPHTLKSSSYVKLYQTILHYVHLAELGFVFSNLYIMMMMISNQTFDSAALATFGRTQNLVEYIMMVMKNAHVLMIVMMRRI